MSSEYPAACTQCTVSHKFHLIHCKCKCELSTALVMQELKQPEAMYRALGTKLVVGMPFKDIATSDSIFLRDLPDKDDQAGNRALRRLQVNLLAHLELPSQRRISL